MNIGYVILTVFCSFASATIAAYMTNWFQKKAVKTEERKRIFHRLMADRFIPRASYEKTRALNSIEVVFDKDKKVLGAWKELYACYASEGADCDATNDKMIKLLEAMAICLDYDNLDWTIIKKSYLPSGISNYMANEEEYRFLQLAIMRTAHSAMAEFFSGNRPPDGEAPAPSGEG